MATHPFGCRVVQRMLENCSEIQVEQILTELFRFTDLLIQVQVVCMCVCVHVSVSVCVCVCTVSTINPAVLFVLIVNSYYPV